MSHTVTASGSPTYHNSVANCPDAGEPSDASQFSTVVQTMLDNDKVVKAIADAALPKSGGTMTGGITMTGGGFHSSGNIQSDGAVVGGSFVGGNANLDAVTCDAINSTGNSVFHGDVSITGVGGVGALSCTGNFVNSGGNMTMQASKALLYAGSDSDKLRAIRSKNAAATTSQPGNMIFDGQYWTSTGAYSLCIPVPHVLVGSKITGCWVKMEGTGGNATVNIVQNHIGNWLTSGLPTYTTSAAATYTSGSGVLPVAVDISGSPIVVDPGADDVYVNIQAGVGATHKIYGVLWFLIASGPGVF